ncbi:hypothetical protein DM860_006195 [Cuscuta australis]|uniref:Uncharacterized protein n=1 Tax=Cuscuta australis TaxID=267555 RepID=A0A328DP99_9ASTE|nr:hypothetical protein DM860_006195 [Cuscuta australis]
MMVNLIHSSHSCNIIQTRGGFCQLNSNIQVVMSTEGHCAVSFYLLFLAILHTTAQKTLPKAPPPCDDALYMGGVYVGGYALDKVIPLTVVIVIAGVIAVVLFKKQYIDRHGLFLAIWLLLLFGSDVLDTWDVRALTATLNDLHVLVNTLGFGYWLRLAVKGWNKENKRPPSDIFFQIAAWFLMFILSWVEYTIRLVLRNKKYFRVYNWYSISIGFISMVENYWTKSMETKMDEWKSKFIKHVENSFSNFISVCEEDHRNENMVEFDTELNDFVTLFSVLVAQQREALIVAQQP